MSNPQGVQQTRVEAGSSNALPELRAPRPTNNGTIFFGSGTPGTQTGLTRATTATTPEDQLRQQIANASANKPLGEAAANLAAAIRITPSGPE